MLWYAVFAALLAGAAAWILTRDYRQAAKCGGYALVAGIVLSLLIVYSGLLGG